MARSIVALLVFVAACGPERSGLSGLPLDKQAQDLEPADHRKICEAVGERVNGLITAEELRRSQCTRLARFTCLADAPCTPDKCEAARDACLVELTAESLTLWECGDPPPIGAGCTASVGQMETCLLAYGEALAEEALADSCAEPTGAGHVVDVADECGPVLERCPDFYGIPAP